jgi:hypothetical protein
LKNQVIENCSLGYEELFSPFSLFPTLHDVGIELKLALTVLALGVLIRFLFAKFYLSAKAPWAFEISEKFLNMTPLST